MSSEEMQANTFTYEKGLHSFYVTSHTRIAEANFSEFKIGPNPSNNQLRIELKNPSSLEFFVEMFDATGRSVLQKAIQPGSSSLMLSTFELSSGVYYLKIYNTYFMKMKQIQVIH